MVQRKVSGLWTRLGQAWRDLLAEWNAPGVRETRRSKSKREPEEKEVLDKDLLGRQGEDEAARFLESKGYHIMGRNLRFRIGELDIVARQGNCIVFLEVKTRRTGDAGEPYEAVKPVKMRRIVSMAEIYIRREKLESDELVFRFDIISIVWPEGAAPKIEHLENAFDANAKYPRLTPR